MWNRSSCWRRGRARVPTPIGWEGVAEGRGEGRDFTESVAGAWDFERINRRHARHLKILDERPGGALRNDTSVKALLRWAVAEREAWMEAVTNDPLLPGGFCSPITGATGVAAAGGSAPGRQPATAHVQTRIALCKTLLHMQQKSVMGAGGNGWTQPRCGWGGLADGDSG